MVALTQTQCFKVGSVAHLTVGHTHEDIDATFSLISACLRTAQGIETPRDLQRLVMERVGPVFQSRGVDFEIEILETDT